MHTKGCISNFIVIVILECKSDISDTGHIIDKLVLVYVKVSINGISVPSLRTIVTTRLLTLDTMFSFLTFTKLVHTVKNMCHMSR